ncbi:uncharacterized protein LOC141583308 [Saimiri boliviensis]|uniref:uncharacterized protein LOC141583308 n=1 Tax=Saimiri boliviensis TaxID=27679 RepID=UPI003D7838E4
MVKTLCGGGRILRDRPGDIQEARLPQGIVHPPWIPFPQDLRRCGGAPTDGRERALGHRSQEQHICLESAVTFPSPHLSVSQELMEYTVQPRSVLGRKRSKQQGAILAIKGWQVKATWKFSLARKMGNVSNCCLRACSIEEQGMDPGFTGKSTVCCHSPKKRILRHWPPIRLRRRVASMEACSIHDGRVDPGISEESTIRHCKPKKGIFCCWLPWCMRPRVAPMEDHNKQEPSSEATPGIHMVDTATQTSRTALQQEDTSVNAAEGQVKWDMHDRPQDVSE